MAKKKRAKKTATREDLPEELQEVRAVRMTYFEAENIKRLKAVGLVWDATNQIVVEAANEQGKSSLVEAFGLLLAGGTLPKKVLRNGTDEGFVFAEFDTEAGKLTVKKTFTDGKTPALKITLEGRHGAFSSGQTILDVLLDHISLDPLQFAKLDDKAQAEELATLMGFDPGPLNRKYTRLFDSRTTVNRKTKELEAAWKLLPKYETDATEPVSVADLMADLKKRQAHNAEGDTLDSELEAIETSLSKSKRDHGNVAKQLEDLKTELKDAQDSIDRLAKSRKDKRSAVAAFDSEDTDEIETKISKADEINEAVRGNASREEARIKFMASDAESKRLDDALDEVAREKAAALLKASETLPVKGLDITEDGVTYKGSPFKEAGASATMTVSAAVVMGINKDRPIKLLMIDNAEQMDPATTRKVCEMADAAGFQRLLTRVPGLGGAAEGSVIIEDGAIKE